MQRPGEALWAFVEKCQQAESAEDVALAFLDEMSLLGFSHVALCSHVDPLNPPPNAIAVFRYPEAWLEHFSAEGYQSFDPVFFEANRRDKPFRWDDAAFQSNLNKTQKRILDEGAEVGVAKGFTIPIRGADALPASCSLVPHSDGVDPLNLQLAHSMAVYAHESARRLFTTPCVSGLSRLSKRERECLTLVARGKSDWVISELLGLSERYVHHTIERAKARLGVATRTQAIVRAAIMGQISLFDAID